MEYLHFDIWTDGGVAPNIYVISSGAEIAHPIPNGDGAWQSIDIAIAGITGDTSSAIQFKFDGGNGTTSAIYVDNLYFWKTPVASGTDATLSDLQVDGMTIAGFSPNSQNYTIGLPGGTTVVPQITAATTTDTNATVTSTTQAIGIPGDATVLVTAQDGTTTKTYTVSFTLTSPGPAPTPPVRDAGDVISIFSEAYANITGANYNPFWGQSGYNTASSTYETATGDFALHYPNFNYQGVEFNSNQDISAMEYLHIDIWTGAGVAPNFYVISSGAEIPNAISNVAGSWQSIDIPITGITGDLNNAIQFKFDGGNGTSHFIYVDNLYFWKNPTAVGSDATLSDLQVDDVTLAGFLGNTVNYSRGYQEGIAVIPQITVATPTDANATVTTITQASSVPGTATVLVTAQDGTTTKTYTVTYEITSPMGAAPTPPARNAADVVSLFSDAYSNIGLSELPTSWSQTGFEAVTLDGSNNTWRLTNCEFLGIVSDYGSGTDLSDMEFMHIDYWNSSNTTNELLVKIVNTISGGEDTESLGTTVTGSWQSIDIDMSLFDNGSLANRAQITQYLIDSAGPGAVIYIDNFYFYKAPLSVDAFDANSLKVFPNPTQSSWNIKSTQSITNIEVFNILGKKVLTLIPNSLEAIIDSSNLNTGLYIAKVSTAIGSQSIKLVKK